MQKIFSSFENASLDISAPAWIIEIPPRHFPERNELIASQKGERACGEWTSASFVGEPPDVHHRSLVAMSGGLTNTANRSLFYL